MWKTSLVIGVSTSTIPPPLPFYRTVPFKAHSGSRRRVGYTSLISSGYGRKSKKYSIEYFDEDGRLDELDEFWESIPPFDRADALARLECRYTMSDMFHTAGRSDSDTETGQYMRFFVGNAFMETNVLRMILNRIFSGASDTLITATDLSRLLRNTISEELGYSLNFITPRIIKDWSDLIIDSRKLRIRIDSDLVPTSHDIPLNVSGTTLWSLELGSFKELLNRRYNRLLLSGYENIDL